MDSLPYILMRSGMISEQSVRMISPNISSNSAIPVINRSSLKKSLLPEAVLQRWLVRAVWSLRRRVKSV